MWFHECQADMSHTACRGERDNDTHRVMVRTSVVMSPDGNNYTPRCSLGWCQLWTTIIEL